MNISDGRQTSHLRNLWYFRDPPKRWLKLTLKADSSLIKYESNPTILEKNVIKKRNIRFLSSEVKTGSGIKGGKWVSNYCGNSSRFLGGERAMVGKCPAEVGCRRTTVLVSLLWVTRSDMIRKERKIMIEYNILLVFRLIAQTQSVL